MKVSGEWCFIHQNSTPKEHSGTQFDLTSNWSFYLFLNKCWEFVFAKSGILAVYLPCWKGICILQVLWTGLEPGSAVYLPRAVFIWFFIFFSLVLYMYICLHSGSSCNKIEELILYLLYLLHYMYCNITLISKAGNLKLPNYV